MSTMEERADLYQNNLGAMAEPTAPYVAGVQKRLEGFDQWMASRPTLTDMGHNIEPEQSNATVGPHASRPLEPGDVVQLKSGGPLMTVSESPDSYYVKCSWFGPDNRVIVQPLAIICLERVDMSSLKKMDADLRRYAEGFSKGVAIPSQYGISRKG